MIVLWLYPLFLLIPIFTSLNAQPALAFFLLTIWLMVKNLKHQFPRPISTITVDPSLVGKKRVRVTGHIT